MSGIRISSRYAKSLLDLAIEKSELESVYADMQTVNQTFRGSKELALLLQSPIVKGDKKVKIIELIFADKLSNLSSMFINLLIAKGRESLLLEVAQSFISQYKIYKKITVVELTSAVTIDAGTRSKILTAADSMSDGTIELVEKVDPELIGGFVLKVDDNQVDTTISTKLRNLKREFSNNPYIPEL
jgi:F-type H+-transporting ATPase subunit delta